MEKLAENEWLIKIAKLPVINQFQFPVIGFAIHIFIVVMIIGSSLVIALAAGMLDNIFLPLEKFDNEDSSSASNQWILSRNHDLFAGWVAFGMAVWIIAILVLYCCSCLSPTDDHVNIRVLNHLALLFYHLVRWIIFISLLSTGNIYAIAAAWSIEFGLLALAIVGIVFVMLGIFSRYIFRTCRDQIRREKQLKKSIELKNDV